MTTDAELGKQRSSETTLSTGWREVAEVLGCSVSIEPDPDPVSSDSVDSAARQYLKHSRRVSS